MTHRRAIETIAPVVIGSISRPRRRGLALVSLVAAGVTAGVTAGLGMTVVSCINPSEVNEAEPLPPSFVVSDTFAPTGYIGDGVTVGSVDTSTSACLEPRVPGARGDCYRITYKPIKAWAGVFWQYPANNWGKLPGRAIAPGATKISFWAASAKGGEKLDVRAGGIGIPDREFDYADPFKAESGLTLTTEWKRYTINFGPQAPVTTKQTEVIGAFSWGMNVPASHPPDEPIVFYLDDIVWGE